MIHEKTLEEFLALISKVHPRSRARTFAAYELAQAPSEWIIEGKRQFPIPFGLGDAVASVATPIARALRLPCIDPATKQLKPESKCQKKKDVLNRVTLIP